MDDDAQWAYTTSEEDNDDDQWAYTSSSDSDQPCRQPMRRVSRTVNNKRRRVASFTPRARTTTRYTPHCSALPPMSDGTSVPPGWTLADYQLLRSFKAVNYFFMNDACRRTVIARYRRNQPHRVGPLILPTPGAPPRTLATWYRMHAQSLDAPRWPVLLTAHRIPNQLGLYVFESQSHNIAFVVRGDRLWVINSVAEGPWANTDWIRNAGGRILRPFGIRHIDLIHSGRQRGKDRCCLPWAVYALCHFDPDGNENGTAFVRGASPEADFDTIVRFIHTTVEQHRDAFEGFAVRTLGCVPTDAQMLADRIVSSRYERWSGRNTVIQRWTVSTLTRLTGQMEKKLPDGVHDFGRDLASTQGNK